MPFVGYMLLVLENANHKCNPIFRFQSIHDVELTECLSDLVMTGSLLDELSLCKACLSLVHLLAMEEQGSTLSIVSFLIWETLTRLFGHQQHNFTVDGRIITAPDQ